MIRYYHIKIGLSIDKKETVIVFTVSQMFCHCNFNFPYMWWIIFSFF
nr:MAG TPA: hypothetical protein [Caudoviricetes sp.]